MSNTHCRGERQASRASPELKIIHPYPAPRCQATAPVCSGPVTPYQHVGAVQSGTREKQHSVKSTAPKHLDSTLIKIVDLSRNSFSTSDEFERRSRAEQPLTHGNTHGRQHQQWRGPPSVRRERERQLSDPARSSQGRVRTICSERTLAIFLQQSTRHHILPPWLPGDDVSGFTGSCLDTVITCYSITVSGYGWETRG